ASFVYRPKAFPGRVVFFQSTDWPKGRYWDFHASWDGMISGGLELHKIRGGHESMFYQSNVATLADKLQDCLAEAQRRYPTTVTSFSAPRPPRTESLSAPPGSKTGTTEGL